MTFEKTREVISTIVENIDRRVFFTSYEVVVREELQNLGIDITDFHHEDLLKMVVECDKNWEICTNDKHFTTKFGVVLGLARLKCEN